MKKLFFIAIALVVLIACGTKSEEKTQKQSEDELRSTIVGSWYVVTGETSFKIDSSKITSNHPIDAKGLGMTMKREFFKDGRYMEREDLKIVANGDTATWLQYSIRGKWEIHGDSLILTANLKDVEYPENAGITVNSGSIMSKQIIKRISGDSLIIEDKARDVKTDNIVDLIMLKEE